MQFRILGPLEVDDDGSEIPLAGGSQRALLALLLLYANEVVSNDLLLDELWGGEPPVSGVTALHVRVSQLRKALGKGAARLETRPPGYLLQVDPGELDLDHFTWLLDEADGAEPALAAEKLRVALAQSHDQRVERSLAGRGWIDGCRLGEIAHRPSSFGVEPSG